MLSRLHDGTQVFILERRGDHYRVVHSMGSAFISARSVLTMAGGPLGTGGVYRTQLRGTGTVKLLQRPRGKPHGSMPGGAPVRIVAWTLDWLLVEADPGSPVRGELPAMGYVPLTATIDAGRLGAAAHHLVPSASGRGARAWNAVPPPKLTEFSFPVAKQSQFGNDFGVGTHSFGHSPYNVGIDIFARRGTPVVAPASGVVERLATGGIGGNAVFVQSAEGTTYYFAHLDRFEPGLRAGMKVQKGTRLGTVGDTGNARGGDPHLHFSAVKGGKPWNPHGHLKKAALGPQ